VAQPVTLEYREVDASLPSTWDIPPSVDVEFASSRVRVDGTGAAAPFIVVLEALDSDNRVLAQARIDQEFAVGDTGALTYAPFLRRRAAAPAAGGVVSMARASVSAAAIAAAGTNLDWTTLTSTFDVGGHFALTGGLDFAIQDAGLYGLHFTFFGLTTANNKNTEVFLDTSVVSGSSGLWSSTRTAIGTPGMAATWAAFIDDPASIGVQAAADYSATAYLALAPSDTFPVVLRCFVQVAEDQVGVAKTLSAFLTGVRFGAGDV